MLSVFVRAASAILRGQSDVVLLQCSCVDTCESAMVKLVKVGSEHTRKHRITVVKSRTHYRTHNHVGSLSRHRRPHVTKCVNVEVAASAYIVDVLGE